MKTTVEISDSLFRDAKQYAHIHNLTLREVVDAALRKLVSASGTSSKPFRLRKRSFRGDGMVKDYSWSEIRSLSYEGRGE